MNKMLEELKPDLLMLDETIAADNDESGDYYQLGQYRRAMVYAVIETDGIEAGDDVNFQLRQAKTAAGGDAKDLGDAVTVSALVDALVVQTDLEPTGDNIANNDTITLNGTVFTKKAGTDTDELEFANAAGLVQCIEAADIGLTANATGEVVDISVTDPGTQTITMVETALTTWDVSGVTLKASAVLETYVKELDDEFSYITLEVENETGNASAIDVSAILVRGLPYHSPVELNVSAK